MAQTSRNINYITRDFDSLKETLVDYAKTYFPTTYNDFSPTSPGMMLIEMTSYVGDILSFYLDNQIQETFLQYARQQENIYSLAYMLGYRPKAATAAEATITFSQRVPSILSGSTTIPDYSYGLFIPQNITVNSTNNNTPYLIQDFVDFSYSSSADPTLVSVYQIDTANGQPTQYLLTKTRKAISAEIKTTSFSFSGTERFATRTISDVNILGILDITDSAGNLWYEVPYLGQETVFTEVRSTATIVPGATNDTSHLLRLEKQPRRFISRFRDQSTLELQFGGGTVSDTGEEIVPNSNNVGLGVPFKKSLLTTAFDPTNFLYTNTYGIAPSNTTLTVRYLVGGGVQSNVPANTLTTIPNKAGISFVSTPTNASVNAQTYYDSLEVNNTAAGSGGNDGDDLETIRQNSLKAFGAQLRTVTADDYLIRALSLPPNYGTVAKAYITPTLASNMSAGDSTTVLDLYVLSFNADNQLTTASNNIKRNLTTYLSQYRAVSDRINIKDAFIINIGVEFDILTYPSVNTNEVLFNCIVKVKEFFNIDNWGINEPIILRDLYALLDAVRGVQTVKYVNIVNKVGESDGYSSYAYSIEGATKNGVVYPSLDPMIFEVKYLDTDIKGRVVNL
jgi:hypothetical protein